MAKASVLDGSDSEERRLGEQSGLDTVNFLRNFTGVRFVILFIKLHLQAETRKMITYC